MNKDKRLMFFTACSVSTLSISSITLLVTNLIISNKDINECKIYYELDNNEKNIVKVNNDIVKKRNLKDILVIIFGILVICFCIYIVIYVLVK